jgi:DNA-binding transcriptional LysR family regulator
MREATRPGRSSMLVGIPTGMHPRLRELLNALAERVEDWCELVRWPGTSKDLITAVCENRLAFALARLPISSPSLCVLPVMSERLGAEVPADRFAGRNSLALQDLADLSLIVAPNEIRSTYIDQLDREIFERGIRKRIRLTDAGFGGIAETVSSGVAFYFAILNPDSPLHGYALENTKVLPFTDFEAQLETALIWRRERASGGDLDEITEAAREVFADPIHI